MWRETDRRKYRQAGDCLPRDLTDPEWERLAQLIPPAKPGGRPRKTDMRSAMTRSSIFCEPVARGALPPGLPAALDGLQHLPRFPAAGRVGGDLGGLRAALRERLGRQASPAPASLTAARSSRPKRG